jgi:DNA-binding response OmpR family regulator
MLKKVIIIEDDRDTLDIMTYILVDEGYEVVAADNAEPLKQINLYQPILILMDNRLPDGTGKDICMKLKSDPDTSHFPVALISADNKLEEIANQCGADTFLKKPFDVKDLVDLVNRFS